MARVSFTPHLRRYFDLPDEWEFEAGSVADLVRALDVEWPGLGFYIADERGHLRKHVAIWVDGTQVQDRQGLSDIVSPTASIHILQALSGG